MKYLATLLFAAFMSGCTGLAAPKVTPTHLYLLDTRTSAATPPQYSKLIIAVNLPTARAGFDTPKIAYLREPLALEYFAYHRWADTPPRMLKPLLTEALEQKFKTVLDTPSIITADLRLDTELIRLQQNFAYHPSRMELAVRVQLTDLKTEQVIATKLFEASETATSDDPYGGVIAANRALQRVMAQIGDFCLTASSLP